MILVKLKFAPSSKMLTLKIHTTVDLFLLQQPHSKFSKKSFVNNLPTMSITTNCLPQYILVSEKKDISSTVALVFTTRWNERVGLSTSNSDWNIFYQCVPLGTVLGPLLFNLYVNSMQNNTPENSNLVRYADGTFVFVTAKCINTECINLERILEN